MMGWCLDTKPLMSIYEKWVLGLLFMWRDCQGYGKKRGGVADI